MALWSVYDLGATQAVATSIREDLLDLITNIDPWDTPFFSSCPKTQANHVYHEWLTDSLNAATSATGTHAEGADFSADTCVNRTRMNNLTQIFRKDISVSDTIRAVSPAGVRDEYEYQISKALREIARNIETTVFRAGAATASVTGTVTVGRVMAGLAGFISATGYIANSSNCTAVSGAISTDVLINLHQRVYELGGNPDTLYVSPAVKRGLTAAIGANAATNQRNIAATDRKLIANIDVFESDFGLLAIVPDRFIASSANITTASDGAHAWLIERGKARMAILRPIKHVPISKGGDATRGMVVGEMTLEVLHRNAHGRLFYVNNT
jgi:hypothetical protein